jgi:hypothetical protein
MGNLKKEGLEKRSGTNGANYPKGRFGKRCLTPFPLVPPLPCFKSKPAAVLDNHKKLSRRGVRNESKPAGGGGQRSAAITGESKRKPTSSCGFFMICEMANGFSTASFDRTCIPNFIAKPITRFSLAAPTPMNLLIAQSDWVIGR